MKLFFQVISGCQIIFSLLIVGTTLIYSQGKSDIYSLSLDKDWFIQSSENVQETGEEISSLSYKLENWYPASVPSTILGALVKDKVYNNVLIGENLKYIPAKQFEKPWWYRTVFSIPQSGIGKFIKIKFEGINYRANLYINGKLIASGDSTAGVYRMFEFNITGAVNFTSKNILAIEIFPPEKGDPTLGFVDWNPAPPDNNMGIWRPVKIKISGDISINNPFIKSKINLITLKEAELTVSAELENNTNKNSTGLLYGEIGNIKFYKNINVKPKEKELVTFTPKDFPQLKLINPRLWWTYQFGKPELYGLRLRLKIGSKISDESETRFGVREVSDYINKEGYRGYKLNGKKILIEGGGWADNIFLNNNSENLKDQIEYIKQMGLNAIRLEGIWGTSSELYNLCDQNGILIMAGWSCQWEWPNLIGKEADDYGAIKTPEEIELISKSWKDQVKWLRNHPSIFVWLYGSDKYPRPELEKKYIEILKKNDPTRPYLASAAEHKSILTGNTDVKMRGPYDYVPPDYWWIDKKNGGAFGYNTEMGPGAEVPPIESIKKMIPENHLWPIDSVWNYHCAKNYFSNLLIYDEAMNNRLGKPESLEEYCTKAQYLNYENTRAMFEAIEANKFKATGVIHWMLNAAWPKLWWQLYDYYLMPGGAFFGTKKACEPLHILFDYANNEIMAVNGTLGYEKDLTAEVRVLNFDLSDKFTSNIHIELPANGVNKIIKLPKIKDLSKTYFLDLRLLKGKRTISSNFYCLSTKPDILDTAKTNWYITPTKEYADLTELNKLKIVKLTVSSSFKSIKNKEEVRVELANNTNELAFQVVLTVTKGNSGEAVTPILWEDNYISLLPGERRIITGYISKDKLGGKEPKLNVAGWNIE